MNGWKDGNELMDGMTEWMDRMIDGWVNRQDRCSMAVHSSGLKGS